MITIIIINQNLLLCYPWCPHCTSFKPEWQKLGRQIELDNGHSEVHSENCVENRLAPQKWGIQVDGFPHVFI